MEELKQRIAELEAENAQLKAKLTEIYNVSSEVADYFDGGHHEYQCIENLCGTFDGIEDLLNEPEPMTKAEILEECLNGRR